MRKLTVRLMAAALAAIVGLGMSVSPASAHPANGFSWSGNHLICNGCAVNRGNLVMLWQMIVWSTVDNIGGCRSFGDGAFGPRTEAATRTWQRWHGLTADGKVGRNTWTKAQSYFVYDHSDGGDYYRYNGGNSNVFAIFHNSTGNWLLVPPGHPSWEYNDTNHPNIGPRYCAV